MIRQHFVAFNIFLFMYSSTFPQTRGGRVIRVNKKSPTAAFPPAQSR
jgi:hypothetical protein